MKIRKATQNDMPGITELFKACTKNLIANGILQWDEIYPSAPVFARDIEEGSLYVTVEPDGEISGCVVLNSYQDNEYKQIQWKFKCGKIAVIHRLMVLPKRESVGVGSSLLLFAENTAARQGIQAIRLDMFKDNPRAVSFYRKHGYFLRGMVQFRKGSFICAEKKLSISEM